ncbi:MAG: 6,7-dimethyl-8-ribityllumazine synthase, partial [Lysobacterales bacterium]
MNEFPLEMPGRTCNIALVASEFNHFIVQQLVEGAVDALNRNGVSQQNISLVWVPGAFELPLAVDVLASAGEHDAVI